MKKRQQQARRQGQPAMLDKLLASRNDSIREERGKGNGEGEAGQQQQQPQQQQRVRAEEEAKETKRKEHNEPRKLN